MEGQNLELLVGNKTIKDELIESLRTIDAVQQTSFEDKRAILERLPENLTEQMDAYLRASQIEDIKRGKTKGEDKSKLIKGRLFEILCEIEFGSGQTPAGAEFCSVLNNPDICGLAAEIGNYRNPDLAYVETDESGAITVKAVAEAKTGELDYRAYLQLSVGGIRTGLRRVVDVLNKHKLGKKGLGFKYLPDEKGKITIAPDSVQILLVPADRQIKKPDTFVRPSVERVVELNRDFNLETREEFVRLLKDKSKVVIRNSKFTMADLNLLTNKVVEKLDKQSSIVP